jgi:hypothetical protein
MAHFLFPFSIPIIFLRKNVDRSQLDLATETTKKLLKKFGAPKTSWELYENSVLI